MTIAPSGAGLFGLQRITEAQSVALNQTTIAADEKPEKQKPAFKRVIVWVLLLFIVRIYERLLIVREIENRTTNALLS